MPPQAYQAADRPVMRNCQPCPTTHAWQVTDNSIAITAPKCSKDDPAEDGRQR